MSSEIPETEEIKTTEEIEKEENVLPEENETQAEAVTEMAANAPAEEEEQDEVSADVSEESGPGIFSEDLPAVPAASAEAVSAATAEKETESAETDSADTKNTSSGTKMYDAASAAAGAAGGGSLLQRFFKATRTVDAPLYYLREVFSWILVLVAAFVVAILINMYVIRMSNVVGGSMQQTYQDGDRVFLSKLPYVFGEVERGDVIVFDSSKKVKSFGEEFKESVQFNLLTQMFMEKSKLSELQHKYYIKRVIGIEGDVISVYEGELYRNGEKLGDEPYTNHEDPKGPPDYSTWEGMTWTVGKGELFVMGDNRNHSTDSRVIGLVPVGCVLGKVLK